MGSPNTSQQKANQAAIVEATGEARKEDNVLAFDRFVAMVADTPCEHAARNGHITPEAAARCGTALAEAELAELDKLPVEVEMDAKLAAVAISVVTRTRFKGLRADGTECGCAFGHRDQAAAQACVSTTKRANRQAVKGRIPVVTAGTLAATTAAARANRAAGAEAAKPAQDAPKDAPKAEAPKPARKPRKLTSGASGNTGRA